MKDPNRIPTARQFFDVWAEAVARVREAREWPIAADGQRAIAVACITERHGAWVGSRAGAMFDQLRDGVRTISGGAP